MTFRFFIGETEYKEIPEKMKIEITTRLANALGYEVVKNETSSDSISRGVDSVNAYASN